METYVDIYLSVDGEKASVIDQGLISIGLKHSLGVHDYLYDWNGIVENKEVIQLADRIQSALKGTGVLFKLTTVR